MSEKFEQGHEQEREQDADDTRAIGSIAQQAERERWRRGRTHVRRRLIGAATGGFLYLIAALAVGAFLIVAVAAVARDTTVMDGWNTRDLDLSWMDPIVWGYGALALFAMMVFPLVLLVVAGKLPPRLSRLMRSVPGVGPTMRMVELGDFCQSMSIAISQSKTYGQAFSDASRDVRDAGLRRWATSSAASLQGGQSLASVLPFAPIREQALPAIFAFVQGGVSQSDALRIWHHAAEDCHQQAQRRLKRTVQAMSVTCLLAAVFLAMFGLLLAATITNVVLRGWSTVISPPSVLSKLMADFGASHLLLLLLPSAVGLILLAGALHLIAVGAIARAVTRRGRMLVVLLRVVEGLLWTFGLLSLILGLPHPMTLVLCGMILASVKIAGRWRYRSEVESLNRWLRVAAETSVSIPVLVDAMADGFRGRLVGQSREFAVRVNRGESIVDAVRRSRLPVQADTLAAITRVRDAALPQPPEEGSAPVRSGETINARDVDLSTSPVLVSEQFVYVVLLIFLAWVISGTVRATILPVFVMMLRDFSSSGYNPSAGLDTTVMIGNGVVSILVIWLLAAALIPWLPGWMVRWVPWFGGLAVERWRGEVLQTLAHGVRGQQAAATVLKLAPATTRVRWIRKRCQQAAKSIDQGTGLAESLQRAQLVSDNERAWLSAAEKNGALADTIDQIVVNIRRRQTLLWNVRKAWLVPLATVGVGIFILVHGVVIFRSLTMLMGAAS